MDPQSGGTAEPSGGAEPGDAAAGSDEAVAQGYFDEWSERVDNDIGNLKEALAHLLQVQGPGSTGGNDSAGYSTNEPAAGAPARQQNQVSPSGGGSGQYLGAAPTGEPEQPPKAAHPYWRRLFGG